MWTRVYGWLTEGYFYCSRILFHLCCFRIDNHVFLVRNIEGKYSETRVSEYFWWQTVNKGLSTGVRISWGRVLAMWLTRSSLAQREGENFQQKQSYPKICWVLNLTQDLMSSLLSWTNASTMLYVSKKHGYTESRYWSMKIASAECLFIDCQEKWSPRGLSQTVQLAAYNSHMVEG